MDVSYYLRAGVIAAAILLLAPMLAAAFWPALVEKMGRVTPRVVRVGAPVLLCIPYALTARSFGTFRWGWLAVYALLPVAIAFLLEQARGEHAELPGTWRDFAVLLVLGLAVDLRWLEPAWPRDLAALGKMLLLDAGIWGFLVVRRLDGVGFDLRLTLRDLRRGLGEYLLYALIAIPLGLWLGFLHVHAVLAFGDAAGWRLCFHVFLYSDSRRAVFSRLAAEPAGTTDGTQARALLVTAVLFGLAHWNKRAVHFNWRYVLMAAIAGVFYGRAWRAQRRVGASSITHTSVDLTWSMWLR